MTLLAALKRFSRHRHDENGGVAVEFAITATAFIVLVLGVIEFGRALQVRNELSYALDYGARHVLMDPTADATAVTAAIREKFAGPNADDLTVTLGTTTIDGIAYRTFDLSYPMTISVPFVDGALTLTVTRRTPEI